MISGTVKGTDAVIARIGRVEPNVREALIAEVKRLAISLQSYVVVNKLSGQVLKRRTGTLAASIQWRADNSGGNVSAFVGSRINEAAELKYARVHEYGFDGTVTVREHLRMMTQAFGREVKEPRQITVHTHSRNMHVPERSYLRSSLAEMKNDVLDGIRNAVSQGVKK
ncbi:MAG: HK97 gp10 family phage protein [Alphaproteobacteria bacterium]|nr:HK97 gp10 family phage protein [Alphaproteobacteria bacterium]